MNRVIRWLMSAAAFYIGCYILAVTCIAGLAIIIAGAERRSRAHQQIADVGGELRVLTDRRTGCQYLRSGIGAPTPRLGRDGRQVCR